MSGTGLDLALVEVSVSSEQLSQLDKNLAQFTQLLAEAIGGSSDDWRTCGSGTNSNTLVASFLHLEGCHVLLRGYRELKILTVDVQEVVGSKNRVFSGAAVEKLAKLITKKLDGKLTRPIAFIPRGGAINNLLFSSDNRLLVYDFDKVLLDVQSPFQHVQILHSTQFGNTLVLDDFVNLAESDLVYTHTFMRKGIEKYDDTEILILGGGDGALLNEVLKENPKFVTMIDIDEAVMEGCKVHMRKACGDVLDQFDRPNYKIIVSDCFPYLEEYRKTGQKFQFVFSDLTDVPVAVETAEKHEEFWDLMIRVLDESLALLSPHGKLLNHLCGTCSTEVIDKYEKILTDKGLQFVKTVEMVPSFLEPWVFYAIQNRSN